MALTASDPVVKVGFSIRSRWLFLQKHTIKPHAIKAVKSFSELAVTFTDRRNAGDEKNLKTGVRRGLLDVIEFLGKTFLLTECGDLWEGGRPLLGNVGGLETANGVLVARTFDGAIYTFSQNCSNTSSSILQVLPGFEGKGGIVKEVAAAAGEVTRLGEEEEKRREEIYQMRLATLMLGDMSVFEQQVEVTYGWGGVRGLQVELSNISGQDLKGELWKVHLEIRSHEGKTWTHNLPVPARLLPLGRLSLHLPLPKLLPDETPLTIATKLVYTGASTSGMLPTRLLATSEVSLIKLLHMDVATQSRTTFIPLQSECENGLFSCLGIPSPQSASFARDIGRLQLERSSLQVLREIGTGGHKAFLLDFFGRKLSLTVTPEPSDQCHLSFCGEPSLLNSLQRELNAMFPLGRKTVENKAK